MLEKDSSDGHVYIDDLAKTLDMSPVALGRTLNDKTLLEMGFSKEKERRVGHAKKDKPFIMKNNSNKSGNIVKPNCKFKICKKAVL